MILIILYVSSRYMPFIYKNYPSIKHEDHCALACVFDPDNKCDFYVSHDTTYCYLGNFGTTTPVTGGVHNNNYNNRIFYGKPTNNV